MGNQARTTSSTGTTLKAACEPQAATCKRGDSGARSEGRRPKRRWVAVSGPRVADPREDRSRSGTRERAEVSEPNDRETSRRELIEEVAELRAKVAALTRELDLTRQDAAAISRVLRSTISTSKRSLDDLIDATRNSAAAARAKAQFANMSHGLP